MTTRVTTERARELLAAATPGPWTHERVGYGQSAVIPDARSEIFVERELDAALIAAAPDLAAEVIAAHGERDAAQHAADALRTALDGLRPAVLRERRANDEVAAARHRAARQWEAGSDAEAEARQVLYKADDAAQKARRATDALLSAAPPRTTVDARVVREYLAAADEAITARQREEAFRSGVDAADARTAERRESTARNALDAALAAADGGHNG
ncbi:MAG: hypothetical protein EPO40_16605 [Myxococcaceae bacterium]|nr:MAG: hypothetical protein EPO40_16605 [Myxococcaceae bacterium]